jgi:hypothetical protein
MTEPKKDVKVWLRPAMHALLKARCEDLPSEPTMGAYIERLVERDVGAFVIDAMVLEEAIRRSGITRDEAERAARRSLNSGFGELPTP